MSCIGIMYRTTTHIKNALCNCYIVLLHLIRAPPMMILPCLSQGGIDTRIFLYSVVNFSKFSAVNFLHELLSVQEVSGQNFCPMIGVAVSSIVGYTFLNGIAHHILHAVTYMYIYNLQILTVKAQATVL